jgi:hypothetical protein
MPFPLIPVALAGGALLMMLQKRQPLAPATGVEPALIERFNEAAVSTSLPFKQEVHDEILRSPQGQQQQMELSRQFLANQLKQAPAVPAIGPKTRREYQLKLVNLLTDGVRIYDVFTSGGSRILRFRQNFDDVGSRRFVISPPDVDPGLKAAAMEDFGVSEGD